jgi:hypothetical protein
MVAKPTTEGLIATTHTEPSAPLEELRDRCNWPVVWEANVRRMQHELALRCPKCVLFWLADGQGLAETARLIAWLRERGSRPYRVAVAYRLDSAAEATLRAAGAHSYLPIVDDVASTVSDALLPLLVETERTAEVFAPNTSALGAGGRPAQYEAESTFVRPP